MKMLKSIYKKIFIIISLLFISSALAENSELTDFYKSIRCLVCDGQNILESDTEFSVNLKEQIKKKFDNGLSLQEINNELISIYGEEISFKPSDSHFLLWASPFLLLLLIFFLIRKKYF